MERQRRTHAEARTRMREGILRLGNEQLAEVGAAALSVRGIARGLGVASSAIYRHVSSRDELLTMLLVDAYTELADAALAADDPAAPPAERFAAIARATRAWAVSNPARWALAYGSPVPGYRAPAEQTTGPGTRVMGAFLALLASGGQGEHGSRSAPVSAALGRELAAGAAEIGVDAGPELAAAAIEAWTGLIGLISAEVFGQLGPDLSPHGPEFLDRWISRTTTRFGLSPGYRR
ncbi:TetR/AcrR family transcriptional regulator [Leucobacter massiliensis]|uniref:HTH tetR-type domain-containing protein n=1 Tax=Leucobacter massiliensis TaxID=1686285 RepID=A0A2S9QKY8_9MICO|nr:TetR/AcrR family transcriptional regulator [Leucobacter massiliensis]PRI10242.1 hypothetical protein B4915_12630 [Leucobacter massiliensis]